MNQVYEKLPDIELPISLEERMGHQKDVTDFFLAVKTKIINTIPNHFGRIDILEQNRERFIDEATRILTNDPDTGNRTNYPEWDEFLNNLGLNAIALNLPSPRPIIKGIDADSAYKAMAEGLFYEAEYTNMQAIAHHILLTLLAWRKVSNAGLIELDIDGNLVGKGYSPLKSDINMIAKYVYQLGELEERILDEADGFEFGRRGFSDRSYSKHSHSENFPKTFRDIGKEVLGFFDNQIYLYGKLHMGDFGENISTFKKKIEEKSRIDENYAALLGFINKYKDFVNRTEMPRLQDYY